MNHGLPVTPSTQFRADLLAVQPLKRLWRSPAFPVALQALLLAVMVLLVVNGWAIGREHSGKDLQLLRKTNLTTLVVWGLWWPGMIALSLTLGRAWCMVCPMELVARAGHCLGRRTRLARARLGRWLRGGWLVVLAYLLLQVLVAGVALHRVPHYTALMLVIMGLAALVVGLVFRQPRAFCEGFCPARALLSVYGRYTPVQLDVCDPEVCERCETRDCVAPANRYRFDRRSCPSLVAVFGRRQADNCVLCVQCAKVCPHDNVGLGVVGPEARVRRHRLLLPFEAAFVLVAAGFVAHEVIGEVKRLDEYFHVVPAALQELVPSVGFGWFEALWFLGLFPAVLWAAAAGLAYLWGYRGGLGLLLRAAATGAAPVVAIAHLAKAAAKISSWGGFLPLALSDPRGVATFERITSQPTLAPAALLGLSLVGWLMLVVLAVIGWRSWHWTRQAADEQLPAARAGFAVVAAVFCTSLAVWPWL